jgi:valyl-tRNA synthetase
MQTSISVQSYPAADPTLIDASLEQDFGLVIETIRTLRNLRAEANLNPGQKISALLVSQNDAERQILLAAQSYIQELCKAESLQILTRLTEEPKQVATGVVGTIQVLMPLAGLIDLDALRAKLRKDLSKIEAELQSLQARLNNAGFIAKAPAEVIAANKLQVVELQQQAQILQERLQKLG